jgi:predicted transcriptional regulator
MAKRQRQRSKLATKPWLGTTITFRLADEDRATLDQIAREMGMPLSHVLRRSLAMVAAAWRANSDAIKAAGDQLAEAVATGLKSAVAEGGMQEPTRKRRRPVETAKP